MHRCTHRIVHPLGGAGPPQAGPRPERGVCGGARVDGLRGARNGVTAGGAGSDHRAVLRRPAVILAIALDVVVVIGAILALLNGFSPIVLAFAAILAMAPWAAIIDDSERPKRD